MPINTFRKASEVGKIVDDNSGFEKCPESGSYGADGKLYIRKYLYHKRKNDSVKPHWNKIRSARQQQGIIKNNIRYHANKNEHLDLESKISQLITKKARMETSITSIVTDRTATEVRSLRRAKK